MNAEKKFENNGREILIVEDSPTQAGQLKYILEHKGYPVSVAPNGKEALRVMKNRKPVVAISDIIMPEMDGYELCRQMRANINLKDIPVILLTTLSDPTDVIKGLESGANAFITKPYDARYLLSRIQYILANQELRREVKAEMGLNIFFRGENHFITAERLQILDLLLSTYENAYQQNIELRKAQEELRILNEQLEQKVEERTAALKAEVAERKRAEEELQQSFKHLEDAIRGTVQVVASIVERRDPYTAGHQQRVTNLARPIGTEMGLSKEQTDGISMAGVIHDLGKISVPAEILSKPGRLTEIEFAMVKTHAQVGYDILNSIEFPWPVAQMIFQHHERIDGSGYPEGLSDGKILLEARILGVADVVEAMASHRPYRPALGLDKAIEEISRNRGILYDPEVVDACLKVITGKDYNIS